MPSGIDLSDLRRVYERCLGSAKELVRSGQPASIQTLFREPEMTVTKGKSAGAATQKERDARGHCLLAMLHDAMSTLDRETLQKVFTAVEDDIFRGVQAWLAGKAKLDEFTAEQFAEQFPVNEYVYARSLPTMVRPILLLRLVGADPQLADSVEEDAAYYPHRLFVLRSKQPSLRKLLAELDLEFSAIVLDSFTDSLQGVSAIEPCIQPDDRPNKYKDFGKFNLPEHVRLCWTAQAHQSGADALTEAFEGTEFKRELLITLSGLMQARALGLRDSGMTKLSQHTNKGSRYAIGKQHFVCMRKLIDRYAVNQIFHVWKTSDGESIVTLPLAQSRGLRAIAGDTENPLIVKQRDGVRRLFNNESNYLNTTAHYPLCVWTLNHWVKIARELKAEQSK